MPDFILVKRSQVFPHCYQLALNYCHNYYNIIIGMYNIPKVVDCTDVLNEWVYPANGDLTRLLNTPSRELPEHVCRFTQDIYLCVYIQPDVGMYGD